MNLVFFKLVRSKTKFWQMVGRGTRLCPDLFAPGEHKKFFYIFDYCQNLEFFSQDPEMVEGSTGQSLSKRLFNARLELISSLDRELAGKGREGPDPERELRQDISRHLQEEVAAMNPNNFVVRPKRRYLEKYGKTEAWIELDPNALTELSQQVAGLPDRTPKRSRRGKAF